MSDKTFVSKYTTNFVATNNFKEIQAAYRIGYGLACVADALIEVSKSINIHGYNTAHHSDAVKPEES